MDIGELAALSDMYAATQHAADRAAYFRLDRMAVDGGYGLLAGDCRADVADDAEDAVPVCVEDPLAGVSADFSGNTCIGAGAACMDEPAQVVAPGGLDHHMYIAAGKKAGTEADGERGHRPVGAEVLLGEDGIDDGKGAKQTNGCGLGVHQQGDLPALPDGIHRFGEGDRAPDGQRRSGLQSQQSETGAVQSVDGAAGDITGAADDDKRVCHSLLAFRYCSLVSISRNSPSSVHGTPWSRCG